MKKLTFLVLYLIATCLYAQTDMHVLNEAKEYAEKDNYEQALRRIDQGLELYPGHYDLLSYKIRLLLWDGQYDKAEQVTDQLLKGYPEDQETLELKLTGLLWQEDWMGLLVQSDEVLKVYPEAEKFLIYKAKAHIGLSEHEAAKQILDRVSDPAAQVLRDQLFLSRHDFAGVSASYSRFSEVFEPWTLFTATYGHTGKHSWDLSTTYGQMFSQTGIRVNANAYPSITPKLSAFVEAGYSPSSIFSNVELGAELIQSIWKFALTGGLKFMRFEGNEEVYIYKGGVGYYFGENYASYRVYHTRILDDPSFTHLVTLRHYFSSRYHSVELRGALGATPVQVNTLLEVRRLDARMVLLSYKHLLKNNKWLFDTGAGFQFERYLEGQNRERLNIRLGVSRFWD